MLERFVVTLTVASLSVGVGGTYAWAQGAFEPSSAELGAVAQELPARVPSGPSGYGAATPVASPSPTPVAPRRTTSGTAPAPWEPVPMVAPERLPLPAVVGTGTSASGTTTGTAPSDGAVTGAGTTAGATAASPAPAATPTAPPVTSSTSAPAPGGGDFTVASLNVLGHGHTKPGGNRPGWAGSSQRLAAVKKVMDGHGVDVVGLQEFEPEQRREFQRIAPGWAQYPGVVAPKQSGADSVAWNTAVWKVQEQHLIVIPYFKGERKKMPYVLLQHRASGKKVWVSSFHNPADVRGPAQKWRTIATDRQVALFNRLEATGHQQVVTGDMNERERYFCRVTRETPLRAAAGGTTGSACKPPKNAQIDWIFGSPSLRFSDYQQDRSATVKYATDHPLVVSDVSFAD